MMFPYYLLPKADEGQAPKEERKRAYDPLSSIRARQPKPKRRNPTAPLVVYTAFGAREAEELRKRLENTPRPVDLRPQTQSKPYDPLSSIQAPSSMPASENRQNSRRNRDISDAAARSDKPKDKVYEPPPVASEPSLSDLAPDVEEESETAAFNAREAWSYEDIFLSMDAVDLSYYSSLNEYDLVREVAISLRHEKFILHYLDKPKEYLKHFATYTWDDEADEAAEEFIQWYVERFRPELERQLDIVMSGPAFGDVQDKINDLTFSDVDEAIEDLTFRDVEDAIKDPTFGAAEDTIKHWLQDLTNDENEVVIAIDMETGEILFVRHGDEHSVTVHDEQKELVEGRNIALLHHHPNNTPASLADLDVADWLDAEYMIVVNQDGTQHHYERVGGEMLPLAPVHNPAYVAESDPVETLAADVAYWIQTLSELGDPPEMVMRQGEAVPSASDYIDDAQSRRTDKPRIDRHYARYSGMPGPSSPHLAKDYFTSSNYYLLQSIAISAFAIISEVHGFDIAGKMLRHHLGMSGDPYRVPVDQMLSDVPGLRQSVIDSVGLGLGRYFAPSDAEGSSSNDIVLEEVEDHTVYAFPLEWREVGIGTEDDIFGFDGDIPFHGIGKLLTGQAIPEDATQEAYDWYLAMGKFHFYPRVTVVVENKTGNAEVGIVIEVRDHYDWHEDAGPLDFIMAQLERAGYGRHFPVLGQSSAILGRFNLNDAMIKNEETYYQLEIEGWDEDK